MSTAARDDLWLDMIATTLAPELRTSTWATPGQMAKFLDRTTIQTPALDLIDAALVDVAEGRCERLIINMPPQEGKSERASRRFPLWMLARNPNLRIAIVSSDLSLARRFGGLIRDDLIAHPELKLTLSESTKAKHEFQLLGYAGGLYCVGVNGSLVGRPVDVLIIDDPYKNAGQADSKAWKRTVEDFWTEVALPRLAPGAPVVLIQCMTGDTPVLMSDGTEKLLRDIRPGDEVATYEDGNLSVSTVRNWANQGPDDLFCIRMRSGRSVQANARHPFLTIDENGAETWLRTDQIRPGASILTVTGGSGATSPARSKAASYQPAARGCATPTTARLAGQPATALRRSTLRRVVALTSSIVTGSRTKRSTTSSPSRAASARSVANPRRAPTFGPTGTGNSASTTTTRPAKSAGCFATTATSPSGTGSHQRSSALPLTTWSVTPDEVMSVEPCGAEDVFDLQIDRTENFIANGLVSHNTRWRQDDLAGWLQAEGDEWRVLNIPAQADHDPSEGQVDALGREPGEFMESTRRRTTRDWLKKIREVGSRVWNAQYQGRPAPAEGTMFKRDQWGEYDVPQWIVRDDGVHVVSGYDELLISWDMTFKGTEGTDFVAGQVWMRRGADAFLLDQTHGRMDFVDTVKAFRELAAKWPQAVLKLVEDKANGPAVISMLGRTVPGIVPEEPHGGKEARAAAVSPLVEAGNVWLPSPELAPWIGGFIEECAGFPTATHDDQVDAMSQALNRLILQPLLAGQIVTAEDMFDDLAEHASYIPSI